MITYFVKNASLVKKAKQIPLPIDVIPNLMGINLSNVDSIAWTKQNDGQLVNLTINFSPATDTDNTFLSQNY